MFVFCEELDALSQMLTRALPDLETFDAAHDSVARVCDQTLTDFEVESSIECGLCGTSSHNLTRCTICQA
jgi:hypothetical protein